MTKAYFKGKELNRQLAPDEAVCHGATLYAASLSGSLEGADLVFKDVIPLSLGTDVNDDDVSVILPRNTPFPIERKRNYQTTEDD